MFYIRYLLTKSIQLIIVAMVIGLLITLCLSNIVEAFRMVGIPANRLTNNYFTFSIGEYRDKITTNSLKLSDMLNFLNKQAAEVVLIKESDLKILGVYAINHKFEPNIISGRTFLRDDFEKKTNTIIISEELNSQCIEKNGSKYYQYDANYFEVIGIFRRSSNLNQDALAYYNLSTEELKTRNMIYDNYIFGNFQIDAGNRTKEIVKKLDEFCTVKITRSTNDNNFSDKLQKTMSAQGITIFPIFLIILLILLNSINIASNWIENRKREISVRRLVGATNQRISFMLFKDFMMVITLSYIPALLIAITVSKIDFKVFSNFKFSIVTVIFSYVTVMLTGLISAAIMLITYYKNSISQIRG